MKNTILIICVILLFAGCGSTNPLEGTGDNFFLRNKNTMFLFLVKTG